MDQDKAQGHVHDAYVRDEIVRALNLLRQAALILDRLAADEATTLRRIEGDLACHRLAEASHATHFAIGAIAECTEVSEKAG
jgi:hypothetical protein